jgi:hypothetical protein
MPDLTLAPTATPAWPGLQWMWPFAGSTGASGSAPSSSTLVMPSGNVNQVIDPWTLMLRMAGNQFGLININLGKSSDPDLEKEIIEDVGTYGKQLGQIGDAVQVIIKHLKLDSAKLPKDERDAILALEFQLAEIDRLKARRKRK